MVLAKGLTFFPGQMYDLVVTEAEPGPIPQAIRMGYCTFAVSSLPREEAEKILNKFTALGTVSTVSESAKPTTIPSPVKVKTPTLPATRPPTGLVPRH